MQLQIQIAQRAIHNFVAYTEKYLSLLTIIVVAQVLGSGAVLSATKYLKLCSFA